MTRTMSRTLLAIVAASIANLALAEDSPLVAAAKRSTRNGKTSTIVITNETLSRLAPSAHVTTTKKQQPLAKVAVAKPAEHAKVSAPKTVKQESSSRPKAPQLDDAEINEEMRGRGDLIPCSNCLPILESPPSSLPMRKAEPSTNPPKITPPPPPPDNDNP